MYFLRVYMCNFFILIKVLMFDSTFSLIMIAQDTMISIENFIYDIIYLENFKNYSPCKCHIYNNRAYITAQVHLHGLKNNRSCICFYFFLGFIKSIKMKHCYHHQQVRHVFAYGSYGFQGALWLLVSRSYKIHNG